MVGSRGRGWWGSRSSDGGGPGVGVVGSRDGWVGHGGDPGVRVVGSSDVWVGVVGV